MAAPMMTSSSRRAARTNGSAMLIALVFLMLLTVVSIAFLSRALMERQMSNASYSQGKVDLSGEGAIASIIGDLQQEIAAGSNGNGGSIVVGQQIPKLASGYYYPNAPSTAVPAPTFIQSLSGSSTIGVENVVKISQSGVAFYANVTGTFYNTTTYPAPNRASAINTVTTPSFNGRVVTNKRWNLPLLMKPVNVDPSNVNTDTTDFTPPGAFTGHAPDWIYVARDGSNPLAWSAAYEYLPSVPPTTTPGTTAGYNPVTQRYAYTIYNEGGTLDLNVAGNPATVSGTSTTVAYSPNQPYKYALPYADLTVLPNLTGLSTTAQAAFINAIVGWRNYSSAGLSSSSVFPNSYTMTSTAAFDNFVTYNTTAFLSVGGSNLGGAAGTTDNAFSSRRHLLQFFLQGLGHNTNFTNNVSLAVLEQLLPYFGTFSRGLSQPSFAPAPLVVNATYNSGGSSTGRPAVLKMANGGNSAAPDNNGNVAIDDAINPAFLNVVAPSAFTRNDGSTALIGEPLVKKRFALSRLAWLTYKGPSANRNLTTPDLDVAALISAGIPKSYLAQGTTANIQAYFGLDWDSTNNRWLYDVHNNGGAPASGSVGPIMKLSDIATAANARDPDFFELLKAGIAVGSLGRALTVSNSTPLNNNIPNDNVTAFPTLTAFPPNYYYPFEISADIQVIQIAANIIDQYQTSGYPVRIAYDDGALRVGTSSSSLREYVSVENYPYFYGVQTGVIPVAQPTLTSTATTTPTGTNVATDGIGVVTQFPIIWNPHDPNTSLGAAGTYPTQFRILADEIDPDSLIQIPPLKVSSYLMCYAIDTFKTDTTGTTDPTGTFNSNVGAKVTLDSTFSTYKPGLNTSGNSIYQLASPGNGSGAAGKTVSNSAIDLTITISGSTNPMFREPTVIMTAGTGPSHAAFAYGASSYKASLEFAPTDPIIGPYVTATGTGTGTNSGLACVVSNPTGTPTTENPGTNQFANQNYLGFYLGAFPLMWVAKNSPAVPVFNSGVYVATVTGGKGGSVVDTYITYRMQYRDWNGNWITYDTKYGAPFSAGDDTNKGLSVAKGGTPLYYLGDITGTTTALAQNKMPYMSNSYVAGVVDPRTPRFGIFSHYIYTGGNPYNYGPTGTITTAGSIFLAPEVDNKIASETWWMDTNNNTVSTFRMDASSGNWFHGPYLPFGTAGQATGWNLPRSGVTGNFPSLFYPGMLEQNCTQLQLDSSRYMGDVLGQGYNTANSTTGSSVYYADPDGVVRRADAGYVPSGNSAAPTSNGTNYFGSADTTMGLPMAKMTAVGAGFAEPAMIIPGLDATFALTPPSGGVPTQNVSRPYILHRPFRSVAELGYAFRGTPWKSVNFSMPESGDSALLDIFTLNETNVTNGLEAGKIDLNTRQSYVLAALIANAYLNDPEAQSGSTATTSIISASAANTLASGIVNRTTDTNTTDLSNGAGPFQNLSELVGKWNNQPFSSSVINVPSTVKPAAGPLNSLGFIDGMLAYKGFSGMPTPTLTGSYSPVTSSSFVNNSSNPFNLMSLYTTTSAFGGFPTGTNHNGLAEAMAYTKRYHEAPIRALVNGTQTRVWNLMIDVIAQTGRFPAIAASQSNPLAAFQVEGERRYWVHVAIDRYTGKVIDEQVEEIRE